MHEKRIETLQTILKENNLDGALLIYSRDIFYYTGTAQPAYLVVLPDDYSLFIRRGYRRAVEETPLDKQKVIQEGNIKKICQFMFPRSTAKKKIGTELDILTVNQSHGLNRAMGHGEFIDISTEILKQRMVKSPEEIEYVKKASAAVHAGHLDAVASLKPGMSELEFSSIIENAQRLAGHEGIFFMRIHDFFMSRGPLTSGPNLYKTNGTVYTITGTGLSSAVPAGPSQRRMEEGDLVIVDIPACVNGYHADQSRTYAIGRAPQRTLDLFSRLKDVADFLINTLCPGMRAGQAAKLAFDHAEKRGIEKIFMGFENQPAAHFIGHGIGLELNEPPLLHLKSDEMLKPGMVLAIELHLMEPTDGNVLKIEDTIIISEGGNQIVTLSPRELVVVEV